MSDYLGPILAAAPGLIAAIVAYLSKQAGKERKRETHDDHAAMETKLDTLTTKLEKRESAEARALKKRVTELEKQYAQLKQQISAAAPQNDGA